MFKISDKLLKYEHFLNDTLKEDCKKLYEEQDKLNKIISEYFILKVQIKKIKENRLHSLKVSVDLGSNCYCQAEINDTSKVCVLIGLGLFVEMELDEALVFIDKKVNHLNEINRKLVANTSLIKAHIRIVNEGIKEIQGYK